MFKEDAEEPFDQFVASIAVGFAEMLKEGVVLFHTRDGLLIELGVIRGDGFQQFMGDGPCRTQLQQPWALGNPSGQRISR